MLFVLEVKPERAGSDGLAMSSGDSENISERWKLLVENEMRLELAGRRLKKMTKEEVLGLMLVKEDMESVD